MECSLNASCSFKDIARFLCKDPTTISKEVKLHRLSDWYHKGTFYNAHNFYIHMYHCKKTNACGKIILCNIKYSSCHTCNQTCADYVRERCAALTKLLTFAMAARKPSTTAPLPINTVTMPFMQTANTESASHHPEPA